MKIFHEHGSKERLFEMMQRVNKLDEGVLSKEEKNGIINRFVDHVNEYLGLSEQKPEVEISYDPTMAAEMASFGKFTPDDGKIVIVATNRNLADILRTLAHEMVHFKQTLEGKLNSDSNNDGSNVENEANAQAAIIMRKFGKANPIIFE